uniref:Uncharacterized protein n=1 Tax=Gopherus evgoodei TaxID=1825980 RepID=A0A8C4YP28_9SAUR
MPHIDNDIKLDFKDVLLRPKRSTLKSWSEVDLLQSFTFRNSHQTYSGIPIIAANMDTVGTFEMAKVLCKVHGPGIPQPSPVAATSPIPQLISNGDPHPHVFFLPANQHWGFPSPQVIHHVLNCPSH